MIFAHGPSGFFTTWLSTHLFRNWKPTKKQVITLSVIGGIGAVFPDIDLFYTYLVDAARSHREFLTHTPLFWLALTTIASLVLVAVQKRAWVPYALAFGGGTILHTLFDTITAQIRFLYPFSNEFYGVADFGITALNNNLLFANAIVEGIWIILFLYSLIVLFTKTTKERYIATACLLLIFTAGVVTVTEANKHVRHENLHEFYIDQDKDGTPNYADLDLDGDGILNINDSDADNDNKHNVLEIIEYSDDLKDTWKDPTHGGLIHVPIRLGFMNNADVVASLYNNIGIFVRTEIRADAEQRPEGYELDMGDKNFARHIPNLKNWAMHLGRYEPATVDGFSLDDTRIGDILFFENDYVTVMTGVSPAGESLYIDVTHGRTSQERTLNDLQQLEGAVAGRAVLLDQVPLFGASN